MRRIVRTLLHGFGAREVYEAEDGAPASKSFTHYLPDIVILDWAMPMFDGIELTQMIRQPGANANPLRRDHNADRPFRDANASSPRATPASPNFWRSRSRPRRFIERIVNVVANPRPFIKTATYFGPDRRRGVSATYIRSRTPQRRQKADIIRQTPFLEKSGRQG